MWFNSKAMGHKNTCSGIAHFSRSGWWCEYGAVLAWWPLFWDREWWWSMSSVWYAYWAWATALSWPAFHLKGPFQCHLYCFLLFRASPICWLYQWQLLCLGHPSGWGVVAITLGCLKFWSCVVLVAWSQYFRAVITVLLVAKCLMSRWFRAKNCRKSILFHSAVQIISRSLCGSSIHRPQNSASFHYNFWNIMCDNFELGMGFKVIWEVPILQRENRSYTSGCLEVFLGI